MIEEKGAATEKFDVILADPPWSYYSWDENTGPNGRTAAKHYSVMSVEEIAALPVDDLVADNCALFLWAVWPDIFRARDVIRAWGFTYRTIAWVWAKLNPSSVGFHYGLGYYTRANTEPCLLAVRGSMPPAVKDVQALIVSPVREHSRKPDEQYGKIERLYPNTRRIELFARYERPGWYVWGNEVESGIELRIEE
jgi:N6-adenosine-specific RNA methylase IME4